MTKTPSPAPKGKTTAAKSDDGSDRIAKVIARAGLCSRRDAEVWIAEGRVKLNGRLLDSPAITVKPDDQVEVDGQPLPERERTRLWLFHKPRGTVTTTFDPEGRPTVFSILPEDLPRVMTIGRLDINTEGLLLLTNDGGLARVLELPATGWLRRYRVRAHGEVDQAQLDALKDGIAIEGILYGSVEATLDRKQGDNVWLTVGLREGKNREVKTILGYLGLEVNRLIRLSFGPFQLGELAESAVEEVPRRVLKAQLGDRLAGDAGADFEAREDDRASTQEILAKGGKARAPVGRPQVRAADADDKPTSLPPRAVSTASNRKRHETDLDFGARGDRKGSKTASDKAPGRSASARSAPGRPTSGRPATGKTGHDRPASGRAESGRAESGRPAAARPASGRSAPRGLASGQPAPGKSGSSRSAADRAADRAALPERSARGKLSLKTEAPTGERRSGRLSRKSEADDAPRAYKSGKAFEVDRKTRTKTDEPVRVRGERPMTAGGGFKHSAIRDETIYAGPKGGGKGGSKGGGGKDGGGKASRSDSGKTGGPKSGAGKPRGRDADRRR